MIITRTPLRISIAGGGTDMPSFYERHGGAVVSMAIDKYVYISVNKKFDGRIRLSYSKTENVDTASELKHDLAKACLQMLGIKGVEITSVSDIPGEGSGLGSSSAFTVGLLNALINYTGDHSDSPTMLAELAYMIECGCGHTLGKQDQYASAFGGLHFFVFEKNGHVEVSPICLEEEEKQELQNQLMLLWTGKTRRASDILSCQSVNISQDGLAEFAAVDLKDIAYKLNLDLSIGSIYSIGDYLKQGWELKKKLAQGITDPWVDELFAQAYELGARGGKLCGAGGGGFLLLCAVPEDQYKISSALKLETIPFRIEEKGSMVIYG